MRLRSFDFVFFLVYNAIASMEGYMDFKQIEAFVNVVRYKSFSRAADATFFTQPTISTHISTLEKELGTRLLDRRGRTVEMTPQGRKFYRFAVEMVNTRELAIDALNDSEDRVEGILELQTSTIPGLTFLPEMLSRFHDLHLKTRFYVDMSDSRTAIENLIDRRGELAFVGDKINNSNLQYTKIFSDKVVLAVPASFDIQGNEISIADAVKYPFIWRESGSATRTSFEDTAAKLGYDKGSFEVVARFNDLDAIIRSVEQGLGVSVLSQYTLDRMHSNLIKTLPIKEFKEKRDFYMVSLKGITHSPVAEAFSAFVNENKDEAFRDLEEGPDK